jgi:hypothetical protein
MIQAFSHIFNFFNIASPCGDMLTKILIKYVRKTSTRHVHNITILLRRSENEFVKNISYSLNS